MSAMQFTPTAFSAGRFPTVVPVLVLSDVEAAKDFYHLAFGFSKDRVMLHDDGRIAVAEMGWPGGGLSLTSPEFAIKHLGIPQVVSQKQLIRVTCDDVDGLFVKATAVGATVLCQPTDRFWGYRDCHLADPFGNVWGFIRSGVSIGSRRTGFDWRP